MHAVRGPISLPMKQMPTSQPPGDAVGATTGDEPRYRPRERFWPYVDVPEEPTDEEIAALDPDLRAELFGPATNRFSVTIVFPRLEGSDYAKAVELARQSSEYLETGRDERFRHRARFFPEDVVALKQLWEVVGGLDAAEVLIDDRPVPYARELWLPLFWFLLLR
jgi:hypothetical protein